MCVGVMHDDCKNPYTAVRIRSPPLKRSCWSLAPYKGWPRFERHLPHYVACLSTIAPDGAPHIVPVGWRYNAELDTIDIGGRDADEFVATQKFRNVRANPKVGFVVDDVLPPWRPRCVTIRGRAEAIDESGPSGSRTYLIRVTPETVTSWGVPDAP